SPWQEERAISAASLTHRRGGRRSSPPHVESPQHQKLMTQKRVWFITGAGRGLGVDLVRAALAAGHRVVATGRDAARLRSVLGRSDDLLAVKLDVTNPADAESAARAAVEHFGRIDVLVNNAGNFYAGYFENIRPEHFRAQMETNFFGP